MPKKIAKRVGELESDIRLHQKLYDAGNPQIADSAFDSLVEELRALDPENALLGEIGTAPRSQRKVKHTSPMLSLEKCYDEKKLRQWLTTVPGPWLIQPKYDGVAVSIIYKGGQIVRAATRGDGSEGEDITAHIRHAQSVGCPPSIQTCELRGELVMHRDVFEKKYADRFANPRNLVAGLLGSSEPNAPALADCRFYAYDMTTQSPGLELNGFPMMGTHTVLARDIETAVRSVLNFNRGELPMECDGVVVKADLPAVRRKLGATAHHPRWAIAWKFQGESGTTTLLNVEWDVSRTGVVTPVAVFEPVQLSGVSVTRATLHNYNRFRECKLTRGARLIVTRRGGVIPHVESVVVSESGARIASPRLCPACGGTLSLSGLDLICAAKWCEGRRVAQLVYWAKTTGMLGFGHEVVGTLFRQKLLRWSVDFYRLDWVEVAVWLGAKTTANLQEQVDRTRTLRPEVFLAALGLDGIGIENAKKILSMVAFERFTESGFKLDKAIAAVPGFHNRAASLAALITSQEDLIAELLQHITIEGNAEEVEEAARKGGPFAGKEVVFTGALSSMERTAAMELVRQAGGRTSNHLTKSTHILVVGDNAKPDALTKRNKALKYGTETISETEFARRLAAS